MAPNPLRRRLLRIAVLTVVGLGAVAAVATTVVYRASLQSNVGDLEFANPVRIPTLDEGTVGPDGTRQFDLDLEAGSVEIRDGQPTETWGMNGPFLGPVLRADRGDRVHMAVANGLPEATSMHWHGMHLPAEMDGGPHQPIEPGTTWRPTWTIDQPAATTWFHPHLHEATEDHVRRGLAGMFIIDDPSATADGLPDTYGVDDIPLLVSDVAFDDDGSLTAGDSLPRFSSVGALGDEILVNGTHDPHLEVTTELVRLRLLNASPARTLGIEASDGRALTLVGTDLGLLEAPEAVDHLPLSPGERAEVVVAMEPGVRVVLRSETPDLGVGGLMRRFTGADDRFDLIELRAADHLTPSAPLPVRLADVEPLEPAPDASRRTFDLSGVSINGRAMDMGRIDEVLRPGAVEVWDVVGQQGTPHNFHVHGVRFQVLDVDGARPAPELSGWQDTVLVRAGSRLRLAVEVDVHADASSPYMFHCHLLRHEDQGMMGQFVVTDDADPPTTLDSTHDAHG